MLSEPHKELRFTRSGQAVGFCVGGAVFAGIAVTLLATGYYRDVNPALPIPLGLLHARPLRWGFSCWRGISQSTPTSFLLRWGWRFSPFIARRRVCRW